MFELLNFKPWKTNNLNVPEVEWSVVHDTVVIVVKLNCGLLVRHLVEVLPFAWNQWNLLIIWYSMIIHLHMKILIHCRRSRQTCTAEFKTGPEQWNISFALHKPDPRSEIDILGVKRKNKKKTGKTSFHVASFSSSTEVWPSFSKGSWKMTTKEKTEQMEKLEQKERERECGSATNTKIFFFISLVSYLLWTEGRKRGNKVITARKEGFREMKKVAPDRLDFSPDRKSTRLNSSHSV